MQNDVLIIGGGVIGLSIARELHKSGVKKITLLEKSSVGQESSWAAAGMLGPQAETDEAGTFFEMCSESRDLYPAFAGELLDETGVDIELDRTGTLCLAFSEKDSEELHARYEWQKKAGLDVEHLSADDVRRAEPFISPDVREALFFPTDWQVENRKLLIALRRYAELNDIEIREGVQVERLIVESNEVVGAEAGRERFLADRTLLATGAWSSFIQLGDAAMPVKVEPVRGQIIAFQPEQKLLRHVIYSSNGYLVPRTDGRILAGSTSENVGFDKSTTDIAGGQLWEMACEIAPGLASSQITDHWAGLRPFAADGLPVLGEIAGVDGLLIATAHYRNGILLAPLTAKLVASKLIGNVDSRYLGEFGPDRFRNRGAGSAA
jgi:glycine oxidase